MSLLRDIVQHPSFPDLANEYIRWYPKTLKPVTEELAWNKDQVQGAYIHVPFCDTLCRFCPFNKVKTDKVLVRRYVNAICREIELMSSRTAAGPLQFIYFGGGTPSVLDADQLQQIIEALRHSYGIEENAEVTLETHPSHATDQFFCEISTTDINRISMGIQSFEGKLLKSLGATHSEHQSHVAVQSARSRFDNVAIDLLYSYQPQTRADWIKDLDTAINRYKVGHLSCYALVPVGTEVSSNSKEQEIVLALEALEFGSTNNLQHYASCASGGFDMALPGHQCKYESQHWAAPQSSFLGFGPGALGFVGGHTTVNKLSVVSYCNSLEAGKLPLVSAVHVDETEMKHRYFVLGVKGLEIPLAPYRETFASDPLLDFKYQIKSLLEAGLAILSNDKFCLTPVGRLYVDFCSAAFFSTAQREIPHPEEPEIRAIERMKDNIVREISIIA